MEDSYLEFEKIVREEDGRFGNSQFPGPVQEFGDVLSSFHRSYSACKVATLSHCSLVIVVNQVVILITVN